MKYTIGDRVFFVSDIQFFSNWFHSKEKMKTAIKIVTAATEEHFTVWNNVDLSPCWGRCYGLIYSQETGCALDGKERPLHMKKDKALILALIEEHFDKEESAEIIECAEELKKVEEKIKLLKQKQLELMQSRRKNYTGTFVMEYLQEQRKGH